MIKVCVLLFALAMAACQKEHKEKVILNPPKVEQRGYLRRTNSDTVIVFVHGLFGGPQSTWTNDQTGAYWPDLLTKDTAFDKTDIYRLGYDSPYVASSFTFDDLIENSRLRLDNDEVFSKHDHVIFVCHSMGGLLVRGLLKRYEDSRAKVPLIYFLSTPTAGSHIANVAKLMSNNPQVKVLAPMPSDADSTLNGLQSDWRALTNRPLSKCAFEVQDTYGIRIVDQTSASALCDGPLDPINENHLGIAKPADNNADAYVAFRVAFQGRPKTQLNPGGNTASSDTRVEGHIDTLRKVEVGCGETKEDLTEVAPPLPMTTGQFMKDAVSSLQQTSNLKYGEVVPHGVKDNKAVFSYRLEGLDKPSSGTCGDKGVGVILIAFILSQPKSLPLPAGFQVIASDLQAVSMLRRPGAVRIDDLAKVESIDAPFSLNRWTVERPANADSWKEVMKVAAMVDNKGNTTRVF